MGLRSPVGNLKKEILARDGKVVIRPDSGDPVKIICGEDSGGIMEADGRITYKKGVIELLWDIFGGTINSKGYKELDPHIGVIYGDAISLDRCKSICWQLERKGFASTNMVYGIGSYTYQHNTRDTFGFALKSTYARINGDERFLFKDPVTDNGVKKSQTGMITVEYDNMGEMFCREAQTEEQRDMRAGVDLLQDVFIDGNLVRDETLAEIRARL